ncbi:hypothetical protein Bpfe_024094 [Biomphalaria pfeifferi]|uniref:Uncharacterized protein n=1 Tax=Biomphalaria pfeifferi TaxID=112525 RepID=A0AAD8F122_BIOPF|nr:hypothetical protein Bpfe_024094 [Biomphalaria pfeifferi]
MNNCDVSADLENDVMNDCDVSADLENDFMNNCDVSADLENDVKHLLLPISLSSLGHISSSKVSTASIRSDGIIVNISCLLSFNERKEISSSLCESLHLLPAHS